MNYTSLIGKNVLVNGEVGIVVCINDTRKKVELSVYLGNKGIVTIRNKEIRVLDTEAIIEHCNEYIYLMSEISA